MNVSVISLFLLLCLTASPLASQTKGTHAGSNAGSSRGIAPAPQSSLAVPMALPIAAPKLAVTLPTGFAPAVEVVKAAVSQPKSLNLLASNPAVDAGYARALIADRVTPEIRSEAVSALGMPAIIAIETAVSELKAKVSGSPRAAAALNSIAKDFALLESRAPATPTAVSATPTRTPLTLAKRAIRSAALTMTMVLSLAAAVPAVQNSVVLHRPPTQIVAMVQDQARQSQTEVLHAANINEAIAKWTPNTHLIIIGDPGLDAGAQRDLAAFLSDKHWTVIVAENADGMTFRDVDGNTRHGEEALEFGAGQGLFRKNGFSSQRDAATGLSDGSILVISMNEHFLSLRNSEAQHRNNLGGEEHFARNLDRWAIENLRSGGDISGAVKDTVTNIDALLRSAVASAKHNAADSISEAKSTLAELAKARAEFERSNAAAAKTVGAANQSALQRQVTAAEKALSAKNFSDASLLASEATESARSALSSMDAYTAALGSARAALADARSDVDALEKASNSFLATHPKATGNLARPDLRGLRGQLKEAEAGSISNPQASAAQAASIASTARAWQSALTDHSAGAGQIAAAQELLGQLEASPFSGSASSDFVAAKQALREALETHGLGASEWADQLQAAKSSLTRAERSVAAADAQAQSDALIALWLKIFAGLATLGTSLTLNWFARKAGRLAEAELQKWDRILEKKLDAVIDQLDTRMDVYVGAMVGELSRNWEGDTASLAAQVRKDAGMAKLYLAMARNIHDRATTLVRPKTLTPQWILNQFWPSQYNKAVSLLSTEPLTFKPTDGFDALFKTKSDWRDDLYGTAADYAPVSENFESIMSKFNAASRSAVAALDEIQTAATGYGAAFDLTASAVAAAKAAAAAAAANEYFKVEPIGSIILPKALQTLDAARVKAAKDPVGAMKRLGALAGRMTVEAQKLSELAVAMYKGELTNTDPVIAALAAAKIGTDWIFISRAALDKRASSLAASLEAASGAQGLSELQAAYKTHSSNLAKAKNGLAAITSSRADAVKAEGSVAAARAAIAAALGLETGNTLREAQNDPSQRLAAAAEKIERSTRQLGAGELTQAESSQAQGASLISQAEAIVASSLQSLKDQDADVSERIAQAQRLDALIVEREHVLKTIQRDFAPSTLLLSAGDASHPNANGTIEDNIDEASASVAAAKTKRETAVRVFRQAQLLEAASLLDQAKAHELIAQNRLDEISQKRARLDKAVADNRSALEKLEAKSRAWKTEIPDDARTMRPTMKAYDAALLELSRARTSADEKKGDPFKAAAAIAAVAAALDQLWVMLNNDRDAFNALVRGLKDAETQLSTAETRAREARADGVADSPAITAAYAELSRLDADYKKALAASRTPHGEWPALDREALRISNQAAHAAATLTGEIAAAARATQELSRAAGTVSTATNWTGSYGVSVPGSPGSDSLSRARMHLNNGNYSEAFRAAEAARTAALAAIQTAEAEVSRRRREEEEERRRQEDERRRRQQQEEDDRRRSSGSGGGFGGSSSSGGGSSGWGNTSSGGGKSRW